jgi:hypothetical protein
LPFDVVAAETYAEIYTACQRQDDRQRLPI